MAVVAETADITGRWTHLTGECDKEKITSLGPAKFYSSSSDFELFADSCGIVHNEYCMTRGKFTQYRRGIQVVGHEKDQADRVEFL